MIDVPVRVKDALRSGDYRKNYRIIPSESMVVFNWSSAEYAGTELEWTRTIHVGFVYVRGWCTIPKAQKKIHVSSADPFYSLTFDGTNYNPIEGDNEYYVEIENVPAGDHYSTIMAVPTQGEPTILPVKISGIIDTINNDNLVSESVKFDERMCSDTELKFGLCEGTSVEFQYFDLPNIRGQQINIELDVEYKDENNALAWYTIPMGKFEVEECSRQASTGIIKAVAYNKLKSGYLDQDARILIEQTIKTGEGGVPNIASIYTILKALLDNYAIPHTDYIEEQGTIIVEGDPIMRSPKHYRYYDAPPYSPYDPIDEQEYFYVYYMIIQYRPVSASSYETDGYYKYIINTPLIWEAFNDELKRVYYGTGNSRLLGDVTPGESHPGDYINRITGWSSAYNLFHELALTASDNDNADAATYEGSVFSSSGYSKILSAHRSAAVETETITESFLKFAIPFFVSEVSEENAEPEWYAARTICFNRVLTKLRSQTMTRIFRLNSSNIENKRISLSEFQHTTGDVTLRDLQAAVFEIDCQYGKLDRVTDLFAGIELNEGALYPRDNLYPANDLLPMGTSEAGYPAMYSKLWADEGNVRTFRYLIITYKSTEVVDGQTQEVEKKLQRTVNANGTDDYNMSDNWLFRNLVWTDAQVGAYADAMVAKMQNISWFPFEMWCAGLPYLEAGDIIEIQMKDGAYPSPILRRNLNGIQNLQDEIINGTLDIF